jgi:hypothetical protein
VHVGQWGDVQAVALASAYDPPRRSARRSASPSSGQVVELIGNLAGDLHAYRPGSSADVIRSIQVVVPSRQYLQRLRPSGATRHAAGTGLCRIVRSWVSTIRRISGAKYFMTVLKLS